MHEFLRRAARHGIAHRLGSRWYVGLVFASGMYVLGAAVLSLLQSPPDYAWLALALLMWLSAPFAFRAPGAQVAMTVSESVSLLIVIGFGWQAAVLTVAVDGLLSSLRQQPRRLDRTLFNIAEPALSMAACGFVLDMVSGLTPAERLGASLQDLLVPGFAAGAAYLLLNSVLTATVIALESGTQAFASWREFASSVVMDHLGGTSLALFITASARDLGFVSIVTALPLLAALYMTFRASFRRAEEAMATAERVNRIHLCAIESLALAIDAKDQVTHGHITRVRRLTLDLAAAMGLRDESLLRALEAGALLHDVGKLGVPDHILNKPGPLTPAEYEQLKSHPARGAQIVAAIHYPYPVAPIVRHHHENWDGTGYPDGLRGEEIPIGARVLAVVDCYDALTSDRPYRAAMSNDEALEILRARRGSMYDPSVVDAFIALVREAVPPAARGVGPTGEDALVWAPDGPVGVPEMATWPVVRFAQSLAPHLGPRDLMTLLSAHLVTFTPASLVSLFCMERDGLTLRLVAGIGTAAEELPDLRVRVGHGVSGWVAAHRRTLCNADPLLESPRLAVTPWAMTRALSVVCEHNGEVRGVLTLYAQRRSFTPGDQALVEAIGRAVAISLAVPERAAGPPVVVPSVHACIGAEGVIARLLDAERASGRALFDGATVLSVDTAAPGLDLWAILSHALSQAGAGAVIAGAAPDGKGLVIVPAGATRDDRHLEDVLVGCLLGAAPDDMRLRAGSARAPDDGSSLAVLMATAETRMRELTRDGISRRDAPRRRAAS